MQKSVIKFANLALAILFVVCAQVSGEPTGPLAGWQLEPANVATISAIADLPQAARIAFSSPGTGGMLMSPPVAVRSRQPFVLVFECRSDQPRSITAGIRQAGPGGKSLGLAQRLNLTSKWTTYRLNFQANADEANARVVFDFGSDGRATELKQVSLVSEGQNVLEAGNPSPVPGPAVAAKTETPAAPTNPMPDKPPSPNVSPPSPTPVNPPQPQPSPTAPPTKENTSKTQPMPSEKPAPPPANPPATTGPSWNLERHEGAQASIVFPTNSEQGMMQVAIQKATGGPSWHIKLTRDAVKLHANHPYELSLEARSLAPKKIAVGVSQAHAPWNNLGVFNDIELKEEWQTLKIPFTPNIDDNNARVFFDLGSDTTGVEIRQVRLQDGKTNLLAGSIPLPASKPTPAAVMEKPAAAPATVAASKPAKNGAEKPAAGSDTNTTPKSATPAKVAKSAVAPKPPSPNAVSLQDGWTLELHKSAVGELDSQAAGVSALRVVLPQATPGPAWQVKLKKDGLAVDNGKNYAITFRARASQPCSAKVVLGQSAPPWNNLGLATTIKLTQNWQPHRLEFKANGQDKSARLQFDLGGNVGHVDIADVKIE
ncbi:MAG: carbohydrate binding domain-containing protein [Planctomycetota bacterium]